MKLVTVGCFLLLTGFIYAQENSTGQTDTTAEKPKSFWDKLSENVVVSGEMGANGELYSISGKEKRRPGSSGRMYFRPSVSIYDKVTLSLDLFLSTEGSGARQDINTVGFSPEWEWGKLYTGDFSMQVSQFSLTDVTISGGGIELNPGSFRFKFAMGKTQKAITGDAAGSAYERTLYGGKIGFGDESGWHFHLNFVRSYDNKKSLNRSIFTKIDTVTVGTGIRVDTSYSGVTPQENMIIGTNWGMVLFGNAFKWKTEATLSLFTADMYGKVIDNKDVPKELTKYFTPHTSTSADVALFTEMAIMTQPVNLKTAYTLVGPGYTSLGMGSLINDRQIISSQLGFNLFSGGLTIATNFQRQNDNTAKQKLFTTERNNLSFMVSTRPFKWMNLTVNNNTNQMGNNSTNDTTKVDNTSSALNVNVMLMASLFGANNTLSTNVGSQAAKSKNIAGSAEVKSSTLSLNLNTAYTKDLSSDLGFASNTVDLGAKGKTEVSSFTGKLNYKALNSKLTTSLGFTSGTATSGTTGVLTLQANYQIVQQSGVSVMYRRNMFTGKGTSAVSKFTENTTTINWSYRF